MDLAVNKTNSTLGFLRRNLGDSNEQKNHLHISPGEADGRVLLNSLVDGRVLLNSLETPMQQGGGNGAMMCCQICHQPAPQHR